jgi:hypothetical protein
MFEYIILFLLEIIMIVSLNRLEFKHCVGGCICKAYKGIPNPAYHAFNEVQYNAPSFDVCQAICCSDQLDNKMFHGFYWNHGDYLCRNDPNNKKWLDTLNSNDGAGFVNLGFGIIKTMMEGGFGHVGY